MAVGPKRGVPRDKPRQDRQVEAPGDEPQDGRRVVQRVIDMTFLGKRRYDHGGDARTRTPAVGLGRGDVIPKSTVLVKGDDNEHMGPLRTFFEMGDHVGDVLVARQRVDIAGMLVEIALRLVERDLRQPASVDILDVYHSVHAAVLEMLGTRGRAGRELGEIVERLMMKLEVRYWPAAPAVKRVLPGARIPGPAHAFEAQQITNGDVMLRRQRGC